MRGLSRLVIAGWVGTTAVGLAQGARPKTDPTDYLPPGPAKALVAKQCTACHDLDGALRLRQTKADWEALVIDMVARGAPLTIEEVDAIVAYLADAFSPTSPPLVDVNTASKDELLKLPGVTEEGAERLLAHRASAGPFSSRDEARAVLGLEEAAFDKIKWYLRPAGKRAAQ
jgi:DNA uptake protein ComE-like DNA-binding protein